MNEPTARRLRALTGLTLCALFAGPVMAAPATSAPVYLAPDEAQPASPNGEGVAPGTDRYDFGTRSAADARPIEHTFLLRNAGATPLVVDHVQPSCGCTTAVLDGAAPGAHSVVAPGGRLKIHIAVDPGHFSAGQVTKSVWVFLKDQAAPAATLTVTGTVRPAAAFAPQILNFGQVKAGETPTQTVTVTLDPSLAPAAPHLTSSDPDVTVTPQPAPVTNSATPALTRTYSVSLSPRAHLGVLTGSLSLVSAAGTPVAAGGSFATVAVVGTVVGDVSASPPSVAFGTVTAGKTATLPVTLTGASPTALTGLTARALGPYVTARLRPEKTPGEAPRTLEVSVSPTAPPGSVQTQVIVTTASGQQLILPVFIYVAKPGAE